MNKDKDNVILKYEQQVTSDVECDADELSRKNDEQAIELKELQERLNRLNGGKATKLKKPKPKINILSKSTKATQSEMNYDQLYALAEMSLTERGLNPDELDYNDLVSEEELKEVIKQLNAGLPREEKWAKSDFIVTFIAALLGCAADIILSNRDNKFTGSDSSFSKKLNELHEKTFKHKTGAPIDYQGKGFGGGHHRELSQGHDLARFVEGIKMFKNGQFEGVRVVNNQVIKVVSTVNQYGNPYAQLSTIEAIINYAGHMFADLFSTYSLPFPGYFFLRESSSRDTRLLAADMYKNGFNLKNVMTQSVSAIIIEFIIRLYYSIQSVRKYSKELEVDEKYSNVEAIKKFINPEHKEKLNEMLLVSHAVVMAQNVGKITFKCIASGGLDAQALSQINVAEIIAVVRYGISVVKDIAARNGEYAKLIYHSDGIDEKWAAIDTKFENDEMFALSNAPKTLVV